MAQIIFDSVDKSFGDVRVLKNISMQIRDEEFMVFVGPSGCGKSTALRMIAGLETITHGDLSIGDRVVNTLPPKDRDVAMVFQSYALYPHMSVRENIAFGLRLRKMPSDEIDSLVANAADILGLQELLERKPKALSGGQRQRVALGRAIVRQPSVFLFDEPLSNLDAELRVHMRAELSKLQRRLKTTTVYVTHDQVEAMTLAERIVVMNAGRIEQIGAPMELYNNPSNAFVAGFIGSPQMNFLNARTLGMPGATCGVRPEHITISREPGNIPGEISHVENLGAETIVYVHTEHHGLVTVRLFGEHSFRVGERTYLTPDEAHRFLFDANGARLADH